MLVKMVHVPAVSLRVVQKSITGVLLSRSSSLYDAVSPRLAIGREVSRARKKVLMVFACAELSGTTQVEPTGLSMNESSWVSRAYEPVSVSLVVGENL